MNTNTKKPLAIFVIYIIVCLALSILLQVWQKYSSLLCFSLIAFVFIFSAVNYKRSRTWLLITLGLTFTLCADYCLVLSSPTKQLLGTCFFLVVQTIYFVYIFLQEKRIIVRRIHVIARLVLIVISVVACILVLKEKTNALAIVSIIYYANLITNLIFAFIDRNWFFGIALTLFALCDVCVGLTVLSNSYLQFESSSILYKLAYPNVNLAWIFYSPSQIMISIQSQM